MQYCITNEIRMENINIFASVIDNIDKLVVNCDSLSALYNF